MHQGTSHNYPEIHCGITPSSLICISQQDKHRTSQPEVSSVLHPMAKNSLDSRKGSGNHSSAQPRNHVRESMGISHFVSTELEQRTRAFEVSGVVAGTRSQMAKTANCRDCSPGCLDCSYASSHTNDLEQERRLKLAKFHTRWKCRTHVKALKTAVCETKHQLKTKWIITLYKWISMSASHCRRCAKHILQFLSLHMKDMVGWVRQDVAFRA